MYDGLLRLCMAGYTLRHSKAARKILQWNLAGFHNIPYYDNFIKWKDLIYDKGNESRVDRCVVELDKRFDEEL